MSSSTNVGTSDRVDLSINHDTENLVGRWCKTLDDFSEDDENSVSITEVDDVRLLDVNDVEIVRTAATTGNGMDVEDDVWDAPVARLGLVNDKPVWVMLNQSTIIQLMNLQPTCKRWTMLQCEIGSMKLAYLLLLQLLTMTN
ncbi:hypothetical protein V6N13_001079 [Hibiscus sabdariffa]|uniref:Uncharacterized protein n=1 Tax=Hibiscus sabdariffa TaxID=183260 RepID=A0ABR2G7B0_9ROSI